MISLQSCLSYQIGLAWLGGRFTPLGAETDFGNFTFDADGYTDARFTARQVSMKVTGSLTQDFQVGKIRVDGKPRGRR